MEVKENFLNFLEYEKIRKCTLNHPRLKIPSSLSSSSFSKTRGFVVKFNKEGEWETAKVLAVQFQGVQGNGVEQFTNPKTEIILWPTQYKTGNIIYPYDPKK